MIGFIKRLICKHEWKFCRNIYGDEINAAGGKRSLWRCAKCGKFKLMEALYRDSDGRPL